MATIRDHVRGNLGETYDVLTDRGSYDGRGQKPDVVGDKLGVVAAQYIPTVADPEVLGEFAKAMLADLATRLLIPIAVDYYMVQTRLVDNASRPAGVTPLGGEVGQNYNRVDTLLRLDELLKERIAANWSDFVPLVNPSGLGAGIRVSGGVARNTENPDRFGRIRGREPQYIGYGILAYPYEAN